MHSGETDQGCPPLRDRSPLMPVTTVSPAGANPETLAAAAEVPVEVAENVLPAYHRCINCPELGRTCGGQKLAALGTVETVRAYHKLLRTARGITLNRICAAAPQIGHGTIHDYFAKGGPDPKWVTVAAIDTTLVAICGDRVGQPPLATTCPAGLSDLQERNAALAQRLTEAEAEIARLTQTLATAEEKHLLTLRDQSAVMQAQLDFAQERMRSAEARAADYLSRIDAKSAQLEAAQTEIRELNQTMLRITGEFAAKTVGLVDRILALTNK